MLSAGNFVSTNDVEMLTLLCMIVFCLLLSSNEIALPASFLDLGIVFSDNRLSLFQAVI
jgi:hypothetical protein